MNPKTERLSFQLAIAIAALVPISAGAAGALQGPQMLHGAASAPAGLDSHFRYLSGLLLGIGLAFQYSILSIERRSTVMRTLGLIVVIGGFARLYGVLGYSHAGNPDRFALAMELVVTPLLLLWLTRIERLATRDKARPR